MLTSTPTLAKRDDQRSLGELEKLLNETKKCLEQQESTYRNLITEKKDSDKALNEKIHTLEDSLTDVRGQNIRLSSQLQYADEKEKLLQVTDWFIFFFLIKMSLPSSEYWIFNWFSCLPWFLISYLVRRKIFSHLWLANYLELHV